MGKSKIKIPEPKVGDQVRVVKCSFESSGLDQDFDPTHQHTGKVGVIIDWDRAAKCWRVKGGDTDCWATQVELVPVTTE